MFSSPGDTSCDPRQTLTISLSIPGNMISGLILSSVFYGMKDDTASFFERGSVLFFAVVMNAFGSNLEILVLYAQVRISNGRTLLWDLY